MKIIIFSNTSWSLYNFRYELIQNLNQKNQILLLSNKDKYVKELKNIGCRTSFIKMDSQNLNIFKEIILLIKIFKVLFTYKPDLILSFTIKPNLYSLMFSKLFHFKIIINITGVGNIFSKRNLLFYFIKFLYKFFLVNADFIFFQNYNDQKYFINNKIININKSNFSILPGSGVDLDYFKKNINNKKIVKSYRFLFSSRFIKEKGVLNYLEAAKYFKNKFPETYYFYIAGFSMQKKNTYILNKIKEYSKKKYIINLGYKTRYQLRSLLNNIDCFVLPTYYNEGVPKSLLEAMAMERFVIIGEKLKSLELINDTINGYYCKTKDTNDLINKIKMFTALNKKELKQNLLISRKKILNSYDLKIVVNKYNEIIKNIIK